MELRTPIAKPLTSKLARACQKNRMLEFVFHELADALVLWDPEFRITGVSQAAETLLGTTAGKVLGKRCQEVFQCATCGPGCVAPMGLGQPASGAHETVRLVMGGRLERLFVVATTQIFEHDEFARVIAALQVLPKSARLQTQMMVAESAAMLKILEFVRRVAVSEATTILLDGENGTGKDLVAKTLHYQSPRRAEPFIAINCAAIPNSLLESELFGYERGAFTDARSRKRGLFELADKGTLLLDEIGEIPLMLQAKLLRVVEEQKFRRLGGLEDIQLDLRVVAATNRNLRVAVKNKAFRQDLYFRLNVIQITIPPLRDRVDDIRPLAAFFISHYNRKFHRAIEGLTDRATDLLLSHDWPGNVRELRNAIERGMILEESSLITASSLPAALLHSENGRQPALLV